MISYLNNIIYLSAYNNRDTTAVLYHWVDPTGVELDEQYMKMKIYTYGLINFIQLEHNIHKCNQIKYCEESILQLKYCLF